MIKNFAQEYIDNPDSIPEEYLADGYKFAREYAEKEDIKLLAYIKDVDNIPAISEAIRKELPLKVRLFLNKDLIAQALTQNHEWIIGKFKQFEKADKAAQKKLKA